MLEIIVIASFVIVLVIAFAVLFANFIKSKSPSGGGQEVVHLGNLNQLVTKAKNQHEMGQLSKAIKTLEDTVKKYPNEIEVRFLLGDYLIEKKLPSKAEKHFRHILKFFPADIDALEKVADCDSFSGKFDRAAVGYKNIVKSSPDNFDIREKLADMHLKINNTDQAILEYRTILSKNLYNTQVKKKLADLFFSKGEYERAINEYEDIIKIDGPDVVILKRIAKSQIPLGKFVDAALVYRKVIEMDDSDVAAYKELGELYVKSQSYDKAAKIYSLMIEKNLDTSFAIFNRLAEIHILLGEYDKAISMCNKLLAENPRQISVFETIGQAYRKLGQYESAIQYFKRLIEEEPNEKKTRKAKSAIGVTLCDWGNDFYDKKDFQAALDKFVEAIQHDTTNPDIYFSLGKTNAQVKNYDTVSAHFKKALEFSNFTPEMYKNIAQVYEEHEQNNAVVDLYYDAAKKHPANDEIRNTLGIALGKAGYYSQAETELIEAIKINPENVNSYYNLALVYEYQKKNEEAKINYKKALEIDPNHQEAKNNLNSLMAQET